VNELKAQEGRWYLQRWSRETFCVIGVDEDFRVIDVRDANGDVDEFAFDEWEAMDLELCVAPPGQRLPGDFEVDDFESLNDPLSESSDSSPRFASD
jgi:hypothetical protein